MIDDPSAVRPRRLVWGALITLGLLLVSFAAIWFTLPDPSALARTNPTSTALIEQRQAEARAAGRRFQPSIRWVPLERISGSLVAAVVASEDATFFSHGGFDWEALGSAARHNWARRRYARGASTITQQLAKNLYLGTEKSLWRKAREALLTVRMERRLDKRRLLALYLNVAEWGDGTFGAEAGARRHFGTGASSLTTAQAVLMTAMLPAPRRAQLSPAPAWLAARARGLLRRLGDEQVISPADQADAAAELERYLGPVPLARPGEEDEPPAEDAPADPSPQPPAAPPALSESNRAEAAPEAALDGAPEPDPEEAPAASQPPLEGPAEGAAAAPTEAVPPGEPTEPAAIRPSP